MKNVIFAGVGGQGVLLAGKVLMEVAKKNGYDVKESEVHGMAQRGGSVDCHVRYGKEVHSPLISKGAADYVVSLELLESMRKLDYLNEKSLLIVNRKQIDPAPVEIGAMSYPSDLETWLRKHLPATIIVDTAAALKEVGTGKALNIVMVGCLSNYLEFSLSDYEEVIKSLMKEKLIEPNIKAFHLGRGLVT